MLKQIKIHRLIALILLFLSFQKILANDSGTSDSLLQIMYINILELESLRLERNFSFNCLLDEFISLLHKTNLSQQKRLLELAHNEINLGLERASIQYIDTFRSEALEHSQFNLDFLDNENHIPRWVTNFHNSASASDRFYDYFENEVAATYKYIPLKGFLT